ncbi:ATP-binding protein [Nocardioides jishulii]|uniref:ATP-binding protein n=1 Tax=Nocardioides jishulii TaxID=2575440 RepID=A0A4U2YI43_9ACTN|nr:ATP-binding protein [Nocardioides jishulii]QCX28064.1 ATP-binding protein [Nocardioides jishulii]TKI60728.1 ATP-binding protein [Nocardioides jishulii]
MGTHDSDMTLEGLAVPEGLSSLHDLIKRGRAAHPHVDPEAFMMLETAVIEIAGNVVEHGRPPGEIWWSVSLRVHDDALEGVLADDGQRYEGDLSTVMPDPLAESGRGLPLAHAVLDELDYTRQHGKNVWTMRRRVRT